MHTTVIVGDLNVDVVLPNTGRPPRPGEELFLERAVLKAGGSAANTAVVLARAGCPVRLVARVGADPGGAFLVEDLRSCGVDTGGVRVDPAASTGMTVSLPFVGTSERAYLTYPGSLAQTGLEDLLAPGPPGGASSTAGWASPGGHLHCASYFIQERLRAGVGSLLRDAKRAGMTTSLDPGRRVVRVAEGDGAETRDSAWDVSPLSPFFEYIDWFMPNGEELKGIAGAPDVARALESLSPKLNGVVVKLGPEGALTRQGGRTRSHPAAAVPCLDTTCAGDAFDAGFLCGLAKGLSLDESVGLGNRFGALAVSCLGLPDRDGVRALLGDST